jgi:hypothetical protein
LLQVELVVEAIAGKSSTAGGAGIEFAWRVHGALDSWTGKVDTKASVALAIESAMFGFAVTLSRENGPFAGLHGRSEAGYYTGLGLILVAVFFALLVVVPQLNRRKSKKGWKGNMIYFGHLRHWDPDELSKALSGQRDDEGQLAQQLVAMAKIAWRKHSLLQISLVVLVIAIADLVVVAASA